MADDVGVQMKLSQLFVFFTGVTLLFLLTAGYYCIPLRRKAVVAFRNINKGKKGLIAAGLVVLCFLLRSRPVILLLHIAAILFLLEFIDEMTLRFCGKQTKNRIIKNCLIVLAMFMVVLAAGYINIYRITATNYTVTTEKEVPEDYRIVLVTDLHYGAIYDTETLLEIQQKIQAEQPDLIALSGDIVDEGTTKEQMEEAFAVFGAIETTDGVYFVYGNHDRQKYTSQTRFTSEEMMAALEANGIAVLADEYVTVNDWLTVIGREDYTPGRKSVEEILEGADRERFLLMLDHQPVQYQENADAGIDLILSGHTHAGQIMPEGYYILLMQSVDNYYGYTQLGSMQGIVSSGIAGWGYPLRLQQHSEYVVIDLVQE